MPWTPQGWLPDGWLPIFWLPDDSSGSTPIAVGDPRYVVARQRARRFEVDSNMSARRFEPKSPGEKIPLVFDLSPDLPEGVTLTGTPTATVTVALGEDGSPDNIKNGAASLDTSSTKVIVPVMAGLDGCDYKIVIHCDTTDANLVLELDGILPVRA